MDFIVDGTRYSLTRRDVEARMLEVEPGRIHTHAVEVNGVLYPVKQVFAVVTGYDQFTTQRARDVLRRLGFTDPRGGKPSAQAPRSPSSGGSAAPMAWVLEIQAVGGGTHEFELDDREDIQALQADIAKNIGRDKAYQGRARRPGAAGEVATFMVAWKNVAAATLYRRQRKVA